MCHCRFESIPDVAAHLLTVNCSVCWTFKGHVVTLSSGCDDSNVFSYSVMAEYLKLSR